ncbi:hypothetical protein INT43_000413, partial [Umbelopsis isabellina]
MDAINNSLDDVIKQGRQDKKQKSQNTKRSQGINKRPGPIRSSSSGRGSFRKSPIQGRRDTASPWKHDLYEDANGGRGSRSIVGAASSIASRLGGGAGSNSIKVENLHYEVTEADVNELFQMVGPCKARIQFDRSGRSSGAATVKFDKPADAQTAVKKYDNVELDGRPMKITIETKSEGILGRIGKPSNSNTNSRGASSNSRGASSNPRGARKPARGGRGGGGQGRRNRSENDLDKEMSDYMGG